MQNNPTRPLMCLQTLPLAWHALHRHKLSDIMDLAS
jgi:hypothetical protein